MIHINDEIDFINKLEASYENCLIGGVMQGITQIITSNDYTEDNNFCSSTVEEKVTFYLNRMEEIFLNEFRNETMVYEIMKKYCNGIIKISSTIEYKNNPYIKDIKFNDYIVEGNLKLESKKQKPFKIELLTEPQMGEYLFKKYLYTFFLEEYSYLCLSENNKTWMSIRPSEINSQENNIKALKGNVLIFGLGLGYATYIAALKENVTSVTVIEKNKTIINIFNKHILPQFKTNTPIKIINDDAYEVFTDIDRMNSYDSCFIDINMGITDGTKQYMFFKKNEEGIKYKIEYWMEGSIRAFFKELIFFKFVSKEKKNINSNLVNLVRNTNHIYMNQNPIVKQFDIMVDRYLEDKNNKIIITSIKDLYNLIINDQVVDMLLKKYQ